MLLHFFVFTLCACTRLGLTTKPSHTSASNFHVYAIGGKNCHGVGGVPGCKVPQRPLLGASGGEGSAEVVGVAVRVWTRKGGVPVEVGAR